MTGDTGRERLGAKLRQIRERADIRIKYVPKKTGGYFSSSQISDVENGHGHASDNVINGYVMLGGNRAELLALREATDAEDKEAQSKSKQAHAVDLEKNCEEPPYSPDEIGNRYVIQGSDVTYYVNADGVIEEYRVINTIRALVPGVSLFHCKHTYRADRRRDVLQIEASSGCRVEQVEESETGAIRAYLKLDQAISPDDPEPYIFSYRVHVQSSVACEPVLLCQASPKTMQHVVKVQFHERSAPERIWWVVVPSETDAEYDPNPEQILKPDPGNFYFRSFSILADGWSYGLRWKQKTV